jgi:serine/threonine-protein kinase
MLGTPLYMSPEQVMGAKDLDHRADLWSLGVVLYEALAGMTPYEEIETLGALLVAICGKPARPIREVAPEVSAEAAAIVDKALAIDRAHRYASAEAMFADLKRVAGNNVASTSMIPPRPGRLRVRRPGLSGSR